MRASDQARERIVSLLRRRWDEGYLSLDTFERRVEDVCAQILLGGCLVVIV